MSSISTTTTQLSNLYPTVQFKWVPDDETRYVIDVFKLNPEIYNYTSWRSALRKLLYECIQFYPDTNTLYTYYRACGAIAQEHIYTDDIGLYRNYSVAKFYANFGCTYGYSTSVLGVIGLIPAILTIYLIAKVKRLHNSYGIISFVQALVMSILLVEHLTLEAVYIIHHRCYVNLANLSEKQSVVDNSNQLLFTDNSFGIKVFGDRIDRYMIYINLSLTIATAFLRLLKSINRFIALYMPFDYRNYFSNSFTRLLCSASILTSLILFLPLIILPSLCKTEITSYGRISLNTCAKTISLFYFILRTSIAMLAFILGIALVIKFKMLRRKHLWSYGKSQQEKILIMQTFCDLVDFIVMFGPVIFYQLVMLNIDWFVNMMPYINIANVMAHFPQGVACLGHAIDSIITLGLLYRLARVQQKIDAVENPRQFAQEP